MTTVCSIIVRGLVRVVTERSQENVAAQRDERMQCIYVRIIRCLFPEVEVRAHNCLKEKAWKEDYLVGEVV